MSATPSVGLFVTCLANLFRPNVGFAAVKLLEKTGCTVLVPDMQTCCGQPAYNSGDAADARALARQVIAVFEGFDYVVAPSGSCAGMIKEHYPTLFETDAGWRGRAQNLAGKCHELMSFLHDVMKANFDDVHFPAKVTYHDSCSGLRELGIHRQPRALLAGVRDLTIEEMEDGNVCCGFGGTFCVKYSKISERLVSDKVRNIQATGADTLLGGDLGCLLNMAGRLKREGSKVRVFHAAEILAGLTREPSIGEPE